jgi:hypothetical protein
MSEIGQNSNNPTKQAPAMHSAPRGTAVSLAQSWPTGFAALRITFLPAFYLIFYFV